ncbi:hypothetical protein INR49_002518, partial [Caranx melampygus]
MEVDKSRVDPAKVDRLQSEPNNWQLIQDQCQTVLRAALSRLLEDQAWKQVAGVVARTRLQDNQPTVHVGRFQ